MCLIEKVSQNPWVTRRQPWPELANRSTHLPHTGSVPPATSESELHKNMSNLTDKLTALAALASMPDMSADQLPWLLVLALLLRKDDGGSGKDS